MNIARCAALHNDCTIIADVGISEELNLMKLKFGYGLEHPPLESNVLLSITFCCK